MDDVYFSLGLSAGGFTAELRQAETETAAILGRIAANFQQFRSSISQSGSGNPLSALVSQVRTIQNSLKNVPVSINVGPAVQQIAQLRAAVRAAGSAGASGGGGTAFRAPGLGSTIVQGQTLNQVFQKSAGILRNVSTALSSIGLGGGLFALVYGFKSLIEQGVEFDSQVEQAKLSLASIVAATATKIDLDGQQLKGISAIQGVQANVSEIVEKIKADALFTNGTFADLLKIATAITAPVLRLGGSLSDVERLTRATGIAASILGVDFEQATLGVNQLLNGMVLRRNALIQRLPSGFADDLKKGIGDVGNRLEFVISKMSQFNSAAPLILQTFKGSLQSVKDLVQQLSGITFEPLKNKLQSIFTGIVSEVKVNPEGGIILPERMLASAQQARTILADLITQITVLSRELFRDSSGSFLDIIAKHLPGFVDGLFQLAAVIKSVSELLIEHGEAVLTVLKYYAGFRVIGGIIGSIGGVVLRLASAFEFLGAAISGSSKATSILLASLTNLGIGSIIGGLLIALGLVLDRLYDARNASIQFENSLKDIDNLNFDGVTESIRRMKKELDDPSFFGKVSKLVATVTGGRDANDTNAARVLTQLDRERENVGKLALRQVLPPNSDLKPGEVRVVTPPPEEVAKVYRNPSIEQVAQFANQAKAAIQKADAVALTLTDADPYRKVVAQRRSEAVQLRDASLDFLNNYKGAYLVLRNHPELEGVNQNFLKEGNAATLALAEQDLPHKANITGAKANVTDDKAAKRQREFDEKAIAAIIHASDAKLQLEDKYLAERNEHIKAYEEARIFDATTATDKEYAALKAASARKLDILKNTFKDIKTSIGKNSFDVAGIGVDAKGNPSFEDLQDVNLEEVIKKFTLKARTQTDEVSVSKNNKTLKDLDTILGIQKQVFSVTDKLAKGREDHTKALAKIGTSEDDFAQKFKADLEKRRAENAVEQDKLYDPSTVQEVRINRATEITQRERDRQYAEIDKRTADGIVQIGQSKGTKQQIADQTSALAAQASSEKQTVYLRTQLDLIEQIAAIKQDEVQHDEALDSIEETKVSRLRDLLGANNVVTQQAEEHLRLEKAKTLELKAQQQYATAQELDFAGFANAADKLYDSSAVLRSQAAALREESRNYLQTISTGLTEVADVINQANPTFGGPAKATNSFVGALGSFGKFLNSSDHPFQKAYDEADDKAGNGILGSVAGVAAVAGPVGQAVGAAIGMFQSFFNLFNQQAKLVLERVEQQLQLQISDILGGLQRGQGVTEVITELQAQKQVIIDTLNKQKINGFLSFFTGTNASIDATIQQQLLGIDNQVAQLQQQSETAAYTLTNKLLPVLAATPAQQGFEKSLQDINQQIKDFSNNPSVSPNALQSFFTGSLNNLLTDLQAKNLTEQQNYLGYLKQVQSIKLQLLNLDQQDYQMQLDYTKQRDALLGLTVRQLSKVEQLAELDKEHNLALANSAQTRTDLNNQLSMAQQEVDLYSQQYGVVQDISDYQQKINAQVLDQQKQNLDALKNYFAELEDEIRGGLLPLIQQLNTNTLVVGPNNPNTTTPLPTGSLATGVITPTPVSNPVTPNPSDSGTAPGQTTQVFQIGSVTVTGSDLSPGEVRDAVRDGMRMVDFSIRRKGLAFA